MFYDDLLRRFTQMSRDVLGDNLLGVYLHGSLAMGCFHPAKSDLDLILVVQNEIPDAVKLEFLQYVVKFNEEAPTKGIELSIVRKEFCQPFVYPTPYELHFSVSYLNWVKENPQDYINKITGTDKDLAAHFTIINKYGIVLFGEEISEIFAPVPQGNYIDSIWFDVENACKDILNNPMYMTLNLCRVLAYLQDDLILSKQDGGAWGASALPQKFHTLIQNALRCYGSDEEMVVDAAEALEFAEYMMARIEEIWERK